MSCCNFGNRGFGPGRGLGPGRGFGPGRGLGPGFDGRRGCCNVNWGSCRGNRFCPGRTPYGPGARRPYKPYIYDMKVKAI